jgi:hypothetical protein
MLRYQDFAKVVLFCALLSLPSFAAVNNQQQYTIIRDPHGARESYGENPN